MHIVCIFAVNLLFLPPPSLSIDAETDAVAAEYDYAPDEQPVDDPSFLPEQLGKPPPLEHPDIAHSIFSCLH
jgi:hypothetical protein